VSHPVVELRQAVGLSQIELAVRVGISLTTMRRVEHGYRPQHAYIRRALAAELGTTEARLFPEPATRGA
jgi:transcriptional regulator with XRE-family HTH domain